ncbi:MAG TPA: glycoside hydrolase family 15 protein [Nitrospiraceae bacterium]|nr:glycoside hydrolase family 15 protein [Nitrospiraceae bacterium]
MTLPISNIEDYALIGDSRTAALVSKAGSIDWLCLPQFDSPSVLNRLLDHGRGGHFTITPLRPFSVRRAYKDSTAVLMTEFQTDDGIVRVTDCMPVLSEAKKSVQFIPFRSVLRYIEGIEGTVEFEVIFRPRPDDGRLIPTVHARGRAGYCIDLGNRLFQLATDLRLSLKEGEVEGRIAVRAGRRHVLWLAYSEDAPAVYPILAEAESVIEETVTVWKKWAEACSYHGPYRHAVVRSALTLKLLSFAPSGAIVAAPTTSLPEVIGGGRNWDYRYCWLRDASYTAQVFFRIGYPAEAVAFVRWLMHATALTYPALKVLYDVYGERSLTQAEAEWLEGYRGSPPVRIGNQAHTQFQLDVYGEVLDGLCLYVEGGHGLDRETRRRVIRTADLVCSQWTFPDHGIWEIPNGRRHYVHSKVMCWVALDRAERIVHKLGMRADIQRWRHARESIRATVLEAGYSNDLQSFVQMLGGADVDATALTFAQTGFIEPNDTRVVSTIRTVRTRLGRGDLVYRYRRNDGLAGDEGAFLPCSFWLVEALAAAGQREEAVQLFERLQKLANDVGLYSEEMDPSLGRMLGNFPQALTHLAHIGAALRLHHGR